MLAHFAQLKCALMPYVFANAVRVYLEGQPEMRAMMLDFLGNGDTRYREAHDGILAAIEQVIANGPKTPDLKGAASTRQMAEAICQALR